jgi:hypothetical protein
MNSDEVEKLKPGSAPERGKFMNTEEEDLSL